MAQSLTSKSSVRLTVKRTTSLPASTIGAMVAVRIEAALGDSDQRTGMRRPFGGTARHSRLLLYVKVLKSGGTGIGSPRARSP